MRKHQLFLVLIAACAAGVFASPAHAAQAGGADISVLTPKSQENRISIDYSAWTGLLRDIVFNMGPSSRRRAPTVDPDLGTRSVYGHDSPLRLEGNRVVFSQMSPEYIAAITEYKNDLIAIGNEIDLTAMSRNEQLAFWLNLHNAITIEQIALQYPVRKPSNIRVGPDGAKLNEAKLVTVKGVALSLNDIRTRIVYKNWSAPKVIYGFFRGDIGGPSIRNEAYTASNVSRLLDKNAVEYVNSLRGVTDTSQVLLVSSVYKEARPYFFEDWPNALRTHLRDYLKPEIADSLNLGAPVRFRSYEDDIADLAGGETGSSVASTQVVDSFTGAPRDSGNISPQVTRVVREAIEKRREQLARGEYNTTVTIEDVPSAPEGEEVE
jgi:hypothetical protein